MIPKFRQKTRPLPGTYRPSRQPQAFAMVVDDLTGEVVLRSKDKPLVIKTSEKSTMNNKKLELICKTSQYKGSYVTVGAVVITNLDKNKIVEQ